MRKNETMIVYIIADNRSGSTLLDYILSCYPGAISLGELHHLHGHYARKGTGKSRNWNCSCGKQVRHCDFWAEILKRVSSVKKFETKYHIKAPNWSIINRTLHSFKIKNLLNTIEGDPTAQKTAKNIWGIYESVHRHTGKRVIIDSSKMAFQAFLLNNRKSENLKFILLERDIRAVAYSKLKRRRQFSEEIKKYYGIKKGFIQKDLIASYKTLVENRIVQNEINRLNNDSIVKRITYEDLASKTESTMRDIYEFLNLEYCKPPLVTNQNKDVQHVLCGSPSRYNQKPIELDTRWIKFYSKKPISKLLGGFLNWYSK